jgi:hypothetical protein
MSNDAVLNHAKEMDRAGLPITGVTLTGQDNRSYNVGWIPTIIVPELSMLSLVGVMNNTSLIDLLSRVRQNVRITLQYANFPDSERNTQEERHAAKQQEIREAENAEQQRMLAAGFPVRPKPTFDTDGALDGILDPEPAHRNISDGEREWKWLSQYREDRMKTRAGPLGKFLCPAGHHE